MKEITKNIGKFIFICFFISASIHVVMVFLAIIELFIIAPFIMTPIRVQNTDKKYDGNYYVLKPNKQFSQYKQTTGEIATYTIVPNQIFLVEDAQYHFAAIDNSPYITYKIKFPCNANQKEQMTFGSLYGNYRDINGFDSYFVQVNSQMVSNYCNQNSKKSPTND